MRTCVDHAFRRSVIGVQVVANVNATLHERRVVDSTGFFHRETCWDASGDEQSCKNSTRLRRARVANSERTCFRASRAVRSV